MWVFSVRQCRTPKDLQSSWTVKAKLKYFSKYVMAWDWTWTGRVEQYCWRQPALMSRQSRCAWDRTLWRQPNLHHCTVCAGGVAGCLRLLEDGKVGVGLFPSATPGLSPHFPLAGTRSPTLPPDPFPPPAFPGLLPSLWLFILGWQRLICGARAEKQSAPTPALWGWGGGGELFNASASLCTKRGKTPHFF